MAAGTDQPGPARGQPDVIGRRRSRRGQNRFDIAGAAEFYELLQTTFEPGAMLLAAATAPMRDVPPPLVEPTEPPSRAEANAEPEDARARIRRELEDAREPIRRELEQPTQLNPTLLINYVNKVESKSPRVVYNLACIYSIAASTAAVHRREYLRLASEYLRQSISRTPPLERRGLLEHARVDPDLRALRRGRRRDFRRLWRLIPREDQEPSKTPPSEDHASEKKSP
jgi:hypothetical protein